MSSYAFTTVWTLEAPIEVVWSAITASERWPEWWPYLKSVEEITPGDSAGIGAIHRYRWRGVLPYRLTFEIMVARIDRPVLLEGVARGDLEGIGRWTLSEQGCNETRVQYDWQVRTTKIWMNLFAPLARGLFAWNHDRVMRAGGAGLANYLGARVPGSGLLS
jgi:polyketide cyclase/dehydrase/lipid transport protein